MNVKDQSKMLSNALKFVGKFVRKKIVSEANVPLY